MGGIERKNLEGEIHKINSWHVREKWVDNGHGSAMYVRVCKFEFSNTQYEKIIIVIHGSVDSDVVWCVRRGSPVIANDPII